MIIEIDVSISISINLDVTIESEMYYMYAIPSVEILSTAYAPIRIMFGAIVTEH